MHTLLLLVALAVGQVQQDDTPLINSFLEARTTNNWTLDNSSNKDIVSVSATGFGHFAYAMAAERGMITRKEAIEWINESFDKMIEVNKGNHGWFYHFIDTHGKPVFEKTVDSIDSVLFLLSTQRAAERLHDKDLLAKVMRAKNNVDKSFMLGPPDAAGYRHFYHAFYWKEGCPEFYRYKWVVFNEGIIIYMYFDDIPYVVKHVRYDLPTFCYLYPLSFYDDKVCVERLGKALDFQMKMTGKCGYGAMPGPLGYEVNSPYLVSPLMLKGCQRLFPDKTNLVLKDYGVDPLVSAITTDKSWKSKQRILIDDGAVLMVLNSNYLAR